MLTKEECKNALYNVKNGYRYKLPNCEFDTFVYGVKVLEQLINEHFDNPPLKFEELKEGMWVWDNKYKTLNKIARVTTFFDKRIKAIEFEYLHVPSQFGSVIDFEENRFYRKKVE